MRQSKSAGASPSCRHAVGGQHHGHHRRGHGDLIAAHGRFAEVSERCRIVVPLGVVADRGGDILGGVQPFDAAAAFGGVRNVAGDDEHGRLVAIGVVDGHGGVLDADRSMRADQRGLAFDLGVAVGRGHRALFVHEGDELGIAVAAVIDHRFMDAAEAGAGRGEQVFKAEGFEDVDHVVRARPLDDLDVDGGDGRGSSVFNGSLRGTGRQGGGASAGFLRFRGRWRG